MAADSVYDHCLPILQDDQIDDEDKTDKIEELLKRETDLVGKDLESATLDVLWRYRNNTQPTASSPAVRHTIVRRQSPAPWQVSRGGTPVASSPRSNAPSPAPGSTFSNRPALLRMKSSQASPFTSPRASPRLANATLFLPKSPSIGGQTSPDKSIGPDNFGDYDQDWLVDDGASNASSVAGSDLMAGSEFTPQLSEMSPYDMMRSVLRDQKTDEEIETILEANGYNLSAAIMSLVDGDDMDSLATVATGLPEQDKTYLVGKSLATTGSRPTTPAAGGKSNVVCKYWLSTGQCLRADCKFSHDLSHHVCKYWLAGNCLAGDNCVFSHDPAAMMDGLSVTDHSGEPSSLDAYQNFSLSDYSSFPSLAGNSSVKADPTPSLVARNPALAPEFVPGRVQSRPTSRHQSPAAKANRLSGSEDSEAFPSLGAAAALRGPKKHHGKRGHGHGHKDKEGSTGSLAEIVRMNPGPSASAAQAAKRGPKGKAYPESRENSAAAQAIQAPQRVPWLETGERANKEYLKARQEAIRHGGARNKFLQSAAQAWNRNDVRAAKALSLRGQSENDLMREAHREAARHLYDLRNRSHGVNAHSNREEETYVDLHGLHPAEAVEYLDAALKNQRSASALHREQSTILYAIVGTGHHSKGGRDKVGKAVRNYLNECRYVFREFSVAGSASGGGSGGILGIDAATATQTSRIAGKGGEEEGETDEHTGAGQTGKIRILRPDEARSGVAGA